MPGADPRPSPQFSAACTCPTTRTSPSAAASRPLCRTSWPRSPRSSSTRRSRAPAGTPSSWSPWPRPEVPGVPRGLRAGLGGPAGADPTLCPAAEKAVLQPSEECVFTTLGINSHLFACTRDTFDSLVSPAVGTPRQGPPYHLPGPGTLPPRGPAPPECPVRGPLAGATARGDPGGPGRHRDPPRRARGCRQPPDSLPLGALPLHPRGLGGSGGSGGGWRESPRCGAGMGGRL